MSRKYRDPFIQGGYYHIYNKVISETILFRDDSDYQDFLIRYKKYFGHYFYTIAYCLIPNHFHFLVKVRDSFDDHISSENTNASKKYLNDQEPLNFFLENQLSRMFSGVSLRYNKKYNRTGPLFKEGIKRVQLIEEHRILYQLCYIHHNPIHHGLINDYTQWEYSSYNSFLLSSVSNETISKHRDWIGGKEAFIRLHQDFEHKKDVDNI